MAKVKDVLLTDERFHPNIQFLSEIHSKDSGNFEESKTESEVALAGVERS
jgi:hypothetical protein